MVTENEQDKDSIYWEKWLIRITPLTIASAVALFGVIFGLFYMNKSEGWSFLLVMFLAPMTVVYMVLHYVIIKVFQGKIGVIWLSEIFIILVSALIAKTI